MTTPISNWIFVIVVLGVVPGIFFYMLLEPWRALRRNQREILAHGQAVTGTVVAIDEISAGSKYGGPRYALTVEFTAPDYPEPVRVQINCSASDVSRLSVYQQVPIHYRETIPMEAVIDELVR